MSKKTKRYTETEPVKIIALRNKQPFHDKIEDKAVKYNASMNCAYLGVIEAGLNSPRLDGYVKKYQDTFYQSGKAKKRD